ncbi:MAG TPA: hypothetical protein PLZ24_12955 [Flavobacteriales bacterium]|nr:hypothetical protein [Flavobacteriales bacterium]
MIPFSKVDEQMLSRLDAVGTDHYDLTLTRIPAVNGAQYMVQSALSSLIEGKKFSGEGLRDLNSSAIFQTSQFGQIDVDQILGTAAPGNIPHKVWTILGVYPKFISTPTVQVITDPVAERSQFRNARFIRPLKSSHHLTQENIAEASTDPFAPGSPLNTNPDLQEYGYTFGTRAVVGGGMPPVTTMTVVGGPAGRQMIAVSYLRVPKTVPNMTDETDPAYAGTQLEWPSSMEELIISAALRIISIKQGDGTTLSGLSAGEMNMLIQAIA